jgi:hypothetical protein
VKGAWRFGESKALRLPLSFAIGAAQNGIQEKAVAWVRTTKAIYANGNGCAAI